MPELPVADRVVGKQEVICPERHCENPITRCCSKLVSHFHVGHDLLIQLTKHHAELGAQKPQSSLWHEPLKLPQASIFSGRKEVEIAPSGRPKDGRCHVLGRAGTA